MRALRELDLDAMCRLLQRSWECVYSGEHNDRSPHILALYTIHAVLTDDEIAALKVLRREGLRPSGHPFSGPLFTLQNLRLANEVFGTDGRPMCGLTQTGFGIADALIAWETATY